MPANSALPSWQHAKLHTLAEMPDLLRILIAALREQGFTERECFGIRLSLEEAIVNAVKHGNRQDGTKAVHIRFQNTPGQFMIEIRDEGKGFDPEAVPDPLAPNNLERPGGRGVFLMRHYMSWVQFNDAGNCVTLCKVRGQG